MEEAQVLAHQTRSLFVRCRTTLSIKHHNISVPAVSLHNIDELCSLLPAVKLHL